MIATITPHDRTRMSAAFPYDADAVAAVKAMGGCTYDEPGRRWLVPIMHLPEVEGLFDCDLDPAVTSAYHALIRRMLADFAAVTTVKIEQNKLIVTGSDSLAVDCVKRHRVGVLTVLDAQGGHHADVQHNTSQTAQSWQLSLLPPATESTVSKGDRMIHAGIVNAQKAAERQAAMKKARRWQRKVKDAR
jgi:hypothetical protein